MKSLMSFGLVLACGAAMGCSSDNTVMLTGDSCGSGTVDNGMGVCVAIGSPDAGQTVQHDAEAIDAPPDAFVPVNIIPNPGGEGGTATGWTNNGGGATPAISSAEAHSGSMSILTTLRSGSWNGPAVQLLAKVVPGHMYTGSIFTHLSLTGTETYSLSTRYTCSENGTQVFNGMTARVSAMAPDNATWVNPTNTFTVPAAAGCTLTDYLVYVESATAAGDFYVDDASVIDVTP